MKVFFLTKLFPDFRDFDYAKLIENLAIEMSTLVKVNVLKPLPYFPIYSTKLLAQIYYFNNLPKVKGKLDIKYLKYLRFPFSYNLCDDITIANNTEKYIKRNHLEFDIIYSHWPYPDGYAAYKTAKKFNKKFVLHFHAADPKFFIKNKRIRNKVQFLLKKSDLVIFVSEGIMKETKKNFDIPKSVVVHNGTDNKIFKPLNKCETRQMLGMPCNKKIILSVCILKKAKRLDLVLTAMNLINDENLYYYIVGDGKEKDYLIKLVDKFNLRDKVFFVGKKPYNEINLWMNAADILVQPSEFESFGQIFVEALLCQTPVIGTNVGGIQEIVQNNKNGLLIESNNVNALKNAIVYGIEKKWDYDYLRKSVEHFSISNMANKVIAEIKKII